MRSKEVEEAIETIQEQKENVECGINDMECMSECYDENIYNDYIELKKKAETLLSYIEELEKSAQDLYEDGYTDSDCKWKIKIRDKIEEYQDNMKKYEYADINIFNENNIRQEVITVLNSLLEGE